MCSRARRFPLCCSLGASRHSPAFCCASAACFCTTLAVFHLKLRALFATSITYFRTSVANQACELAAAPHATCRQPTHLRTIEIEPNTLRYFLNILFGQTGDCAVIARRGAGIAFIYARLKLFVCHQNFLFKRIVILGKPGFRSLQWG